MPNIKEIIGGADGKIDEIEETVAKIDEFE